MNPVLKISFYWLLIAFGLVIQSNIELMKRVFFSAEANISGAEGIPTPVHVLFIGTMIIPALFSFLNTKLSNKTIFLWISIVYAILLLIVNVYHFIADGISDLTNISKIAILLFISIVNAFLVIELFQSRKKV